MVKGKPGEQKNWINWLRSFDNASDAPLRPEPVFKEIRRIAEENAVFVTDVGNTTIHAIRLLDMNGKQRFTTSGWFATMGNGIPVVLLQSLVSPNAKYLR